MNEDTLIKIFITAFGGASIIAGSLGYLFKTIIEHRLQKNLGDHKASIDQKFQNELVKYKTSIEHQFQKEFEDYKYLLTEKASIRDTVNKYSRVILLSATDLQDRLWHLCERQATSANKVLLAEKDLSPAYSSWPMTKRHYLTSTIYLFSRYFCWVEILKSRVRFLEFGDDAKTSAFNYHLKRVERALAETSLQKLSKNKISTDKPIFQLMQTEIGEQLRSEVIGEDQCMSFHDFRTKFDEILNANEGMQELQVLIISSMSDAESNFCLMRLKIVCNALMDMVIFLCEHNNLIPAENLEKIKIDAFDINKYLENWPAEMPNSAVQPTAFV